MKQLILLLLCFFPFVLSAQSPAYGNLTIFSEKGDKFFLYLNGEKKNEVAQSRVRVEKLTEHSYQVKVVYDDASKFTYTRSNVFISDGDDNFMDAAYRLSRNGSSAKLRYYAMNPVKENVVPLLPGDRAKNQFTGNESSTGTLRVFSEQSEPFFLYLDGEKQNETAQVDIRIENLDRLFYNVKVVFKDTRLAAVAKNKVYVSDGDDVMMDATYKISRTSWYGKLKFFAINPVDPAFVAPPGMFVHRYGTNQSFVASQSVKPVENKPQDKQKTTKGVITDIKITDKDSRATKKSTPAEPANSTNTKKDEPSAVAVAKPVNNTPANSDTKTTAGSKPLSIDPATVVVKEPSDWVCQNEWPMWKAEYALAKKKIASASSDKQKLDAAKQLAGQHCLSSDQVTEIGALLAQEETKIEFAKFAFSHTIDVKNYMRVMRIFSTDKAKETVIRFIATM